MESGVFPRPVAGVSAREKDLKSFRMYTSQLIANGTVRQRDIVRAFRVPLATVKRYMKVHRNRGPQVFFSNRGGARRPC